MDNQHHQKMREKVSENQQQGKSKLNPQGKKLVEGQKQPAPPPSAASPPSSSSSPAHEFSFTISLHHQQQPPSTAAATKLPQPSSFAVDLSPADEIFFHGHLLPLHLLSHLPVSSSSPRSSTNSLDSFTLPIRELIQDQIPTTHTHPIGEKPKPKSKSFSLFGIPKRRKETEETEETEKQRKRKLRFDLSQVIKRYMRMVRPLLSSLRGGRRENLQLRRQPYSFSGYLSPKNKRELRGKRGEFSAPASMKTSPSNSGLLVGNGVVSTCSSSSTSDSTMEELQAAIQAAIAHCKNSIAMEEKIKC